MIEHRANAHEIDLWKYVEDKKPQIEKSLRQYLPLAPANIETRFNEAVEYALLSGGKRLRPILTLLGAELVGGKSENIVPAACGVEFIHTSSLIFDDLPSMDNSNERRGSASLHEKFGEGLAILVALGFLNASYRLVFVNHADAPERAIRAHEEIVDCVGASGMVGGQSVDLALAQSADADIFSKENKANSKNNKDDYEFESIRNLKTSALMRLALRVGAILAGANLIELDNLARFTELLGDAYQLSDDLLDLEEDAKIFQSNKTFAAQKTEGAQIKLQTIIDEAKRVLNESFPPNRARGCLIQLTDYLAERKV